MRKHLAIFSPEAALRIFEGQKRVETRFSQNRIAPFGTVSVGETVYIKPAGKDISGQFVVKKVISFENLDELDWKMIKKTYGKELSFGSEELDNAYFNQKKAARFGTIIFIENVERFIASPIKITKKDQRAWVVLG